MTSRSGELVNALMLIAIGMLVGGHAAPQLADFTVAFLVVTAISASATIWNLRFDKDAGAELSGHR